MWLSNQRVVTTTDEGIPLKESRVVPMNIAVAPAPMSLTDEMIWVVSKSSYVRTAMPSAVSSLASTDAVGQVVVDIVALKS